MPPKKTNASSIVAPKPAPEPVTPPAAASPAAAAPHAQCVDGVCAAPAASAGRKKK